MDKELTFEYTYSAEQQEEIRAIRKKYLPKEADKMEQLRKLHDSATQKAQVCSITMGIIGTLVFGTALSIILTELGLLFGELSMLVGVLAGLAGLILIAAAYPVYTTVLNKERERIAPEILRLSDELLK